MIHSPFGEFATVEAERVYLNALRRLSIARRWQIVAAMRQMAIEMVRATVRAQHPDWSERMVKHAATRQVMEAHGTAIRTD